MSADHLDTIFHFVRPSYNDGPPVSEKRYLAALEVLIASRGVAEIMVRKGYTTRSLIYDTAIVLWSVDQRLRTAERRQIAADLVPLRRKVLKVVEDTKTVPRGCKITPIPDLTDWRGAAAFWSKLVINQETGCWVMPGANGKHPRVRIHGRLYSAHRVAYTLRHGAIPVGKGYHGTEVMHSCDNPPCCNPDHLSLGTQRDNVLDMVAKGRGGFAHNGVGR